MNIKPICVSYNINRKFGYNATEVVSIECEEDFKTRYIDVYLYADNVRNTVDISGSTVTARLVTTPEYDSLLLSDNVACEVAGTGHIIIPIDSAVIAAYPCDFLAEVHIKNGENVLVLPFPLWVSMRASILDNAGVTPKSQGTVPKLLKDATKALEDAEAAIKNAGDYEKLENKPQINGHTLSGNKTSDDLGLQKKLTAGQNITIESDGTISADGGGVTSYNDLTDKPNVSNYAPSQREQTHPLTGTLDLYPFTSTYDSSTKKNSLRLDVSNLFEGFRSLYTIYNFEDLPTSHGVFACNYASSGYVKPLPDFIKPLSDFLVVYNLSTPTSQGLAQVIFWVDKNSGEAKSAFRVGTQNFYTVSSWREIGSGAQIVSGAVNQNGTITFTDSDGNTFTTTGSSVIGADGFSPTATVTQTASGATVSITDKNGTTTANISNGADGQDYVLTAQDKSDIASIVLGELPTTEGVLYGNTNN